MIVGMPEVSGEKIDRGFSNHGRWNDESRLSSLQNAMYAPQMPGQRNTQLLEALRRSVY